MGFTDFGAEVRLINFERSNIMCFGPLLIPASQVISYRLTDAEIELKTLGVLVLINVQPKEFSTGEVPLDWPFYVKNTNEMFEADVHDYKIVY